MIQVCFPAAYEAAKEFAAIARKNGCKPKWWPYYEAYVCTCEDELHFADQQCSVINSISAKRKRCKR